MADYFLYDRLKEGRGDRVAIETKDAKVTYRELCREADKFGNVLRDLGVEPEDRVLIALPDQVEFAAGIFGTLRIGGVVGMVNSLLPAEDLAYFVDYARARVMLCDPDVAAKLAPLLDRFPLLRALIVVGTTDVRHRKLQRYADLVAFAKDTLTPWLTSKDDPAYWLFTSGTTGKPKAAIHLHHDFAWNCERYAKDVLGYGPEDRTMSVAKLYFGYGTGTNLFFPLAVGATSCLFAEKATPEALVENLRRFRPTILTSVPTSLNALANHPGVESQDLSSLRFVISAGEPLPPELYHRFKERFGVEILDGIGSAETFHIYITNQPGDVTPGSLGRLVPGYEAKITGPDGQELVGEAVGTLWVKGDSVATGYWQAHEKSKETFLGDWVKTADLFRRDSEGRFWHSGRADDMLKVGGLFVSPLEVEDTLLSHPAVSETCVVGYEDGGLQKTFAFVLLKDGRSPSEDLAVDIAQFAKSKLAAYKFPRRVRFVDELPRNDRGKVERRKLRDQLHGEAWKDSYNTDVARAARAH